MEILEIVKEIFQLSLTNMVNVLPLGVIDFFIFGIGAFLIELASYIVLFFIWKYSLGTIQFEILDRNTFTSFIKNSCLKSEQENYFNESNSFFKETIYFTLTTLIALVGVGTSTTFLVGLFFTIKTSRRIIVNYTINFNAIKKATSEMFNENEVYCKILMSEEYRLSKLFESSEPGLAEELAVLELKFKELTRSNALDKELAINIMNANKINSTIKNLINDRYSEMILEK